MLISLGSAAADNVNGGAEAFISSQWYGFKLGFAYAGSNPATFKQL
jgi:hypothetical protein